MNELIVLRPWENEPLSAEWIHESSGYSCLMKRGPRGHWCGYVKVPDNHPLYCKEYNEEVESLRDLCEAREKSEIGEVGPVLTLIMALGGVQPRADNIINVHGGLTFSGPWEGYPGWWFGFDCAHAGDLCPDRDDLFSFPGDVYRDFDFVVAQCHKLAEQLKALEL